MIIGFLGEPSRPIVEAMGMPRSMCVAWMSPLESESRMAAQLAPFTMVALMPYFLKKPFSCAITMGEQSVSAIMPNRRSGVSGRSASPTMAGAATASALSLAPIYIRLPRRLRRVMLHPSAANDARNVLLVRGCLESILFDSFCGLSQR